MSKVRLTQKVNFIPSEYRPLSEKERALAQVREAIKLLEIAAPNLPREKKRFLVDFLSEADLVFGRQNVAGKTLRDWWARFNEKP